MNNFFILMGPPGSGRDEYVNEFQSNPTMKVLRGEDKETVLEQELERMMNKGLDIIYNASNCSGKKREKLINNLREKYPNIKVHGIVFNTEVKTCVNEDKNRKNPVGPEAIRILHEQLIGNFPTIKEGFSSLTVLEKRDNVFEIKDFQVSEELKKNVMLKGGHTKELEREEK